jgi:hypothetical protein
MVLLQNGVQQLRSPAKDSRHSAVALLLKAALIQVSDYRLLGASGLFSSRLERVGVGGLKVILLY